MRYIIAIFLSVLQASSLVCMVNENNGSHEDHSTSYSQEHEIDWDHIFDDSDDEGIDIFDDLEQYGLYVQENDLFAGDSSDTQHAREDVSEKRYEVHETGSTDREGTSVVHTTRSDDARNIFGVLSDKDSAFLENITYDERIRKDEQRNQPPLGSDLDENYQDTYKSKYIIREYVDQPPLSQISSENITYDSNRGKHIAVCPVQNCNKTFEGKIRSDARRQTRGHENTDHKKKYVYICHYCDFCGYRPSVVLKHVSRKHQPSQNSYDNRDGDSLHNNAEEQDACSGERYRDAQKKNYIEREYIDRPSLSQIPSENITYDNNKGKYIAVCPVQNCNKTFEGKIRGVARRQTRDHENTDHKKKYAYICSCCGFHTYGYRLIGKHVLRKHQPSQNSYDNRDGDSLHNNAEEQDACSGERYRDAQKKNYIEREYIDRPSLSQIPSENIAYDSNKGKYIAVCPVQNCNKTFEGKIRGDAQRHTRDHENTDHKKKYVYMCHYCDFYGYRSSVINQHVSRKHRSLQDVHDNSGYSLYSYTGKQSACSSSSDILPQEVEQAGVNSMREYNSAHASEVYSTSHRYTTSSNVEGESGADSTLLDNITYEERIQDDEQRHELPLGRGVDENYQDTYKSKYIIREYIDRPPLSEIPSGDMTYDSNKGKYIAVCPVQNCDKTFEGKIRSDARRHTRDHENADHKKKYVYICHYCDFYGYQSSAVNQHVSRKHQSLRNDVNQKGSLHSHTGGRAACSSSSDILPQETDQAGVDRDTNVHWSNSNEGQELQILDYVLQQAWQEYNSAHSSEADSISSRYTTSSNVAGESGPNKRNRSESETEPRKHMRF